jgi:very-short-patch-repair endonuclease
MQRDNDLTIDGYRVLRFPAFVVRDHPQAVAMQIARALGPAGGPEPGRPGAHGHRVS